MNRIYKEKINLLLGNLMQGDIYLPCGIMTEQEKWDQVKILAESKHKSIIG